MMKTRFTREEADRYIQTVREDYDFVRIVAPESRHVCELSTCVETGEVCHSFWNRRERCENCTSNHALHTKGRAVKLETLRGRTYLIISRYLEIDGQPHVLELISDITDTFYMESDARNEISEIIGSFNHQLVMDSLTNVYNRRFLEENFVPSLSCCYDKELPFAIAFIDVDGFKEINDTYGHMAGDIVLKDVAAFWKMHFNSRVRNQERITARFGGDEFVIAAVGLSGRAFRDMVLRYDRQMRKICYFRDGIEFHFDFSIGFASSEELPGSFAWETMLDLADRNMYVEKKRKGKPQQVSDDMQR